MASASSAGPNRFRFEGTRGNSPDLSSFAERPWDCGDFRPACCEVKQVIDARSRECFKLAINCEANDPPQHVCARAMRPYKHVSAPSWRCTIASANNGGGGPIEMNQRIATPKSRHMGLVVVASASGTVFEWYDFFIFGSLASVIAAHFYSGVSVSTGFILALLTFAAGYFVRPFGALVFGRFGDRVGRKRAFLVTMTIMGLATVGVGLLGDRAQWGPVSAYALVSLRVLQGFAIGGEYGGAAVYVAEHASPGRRGAATGWIQGAAPLGVFMALAAVYSTRALLGEQVFNDWGWRIPFLSSAVLLAISLWIRLRLNESPMFLRMQEETQLSPAPIAESFLRWSNLKIVLVAFFGIAASQGTVWYSAHFYTQFFLERVLKVPPLTVYALIMTISVASALMSVFFAWLSDRVGRKPIMLFALALSALFYFPGFRMLTEAVNPALAAATARAPVIVAAVPVDCSLQFDLVGKATYSSSCDIAKSALTNAGVPYRNETKPSGDASVRIGAAIFASPDVRRLGRTESALAKSQFEKTLKRALAGAGYPLGARQDAIDIPKALATLMVMISA